MRIDLHSSDLRIESRTWDTKPGCCTQRSGDASPAFSQGSLNAFFLSSQNLFDERPAQRLNSNRLSGEPLLIDRKGFGFTNNYRPFNHVLKLANVARPRIGPKYFKALLVDTSYLLSYLARIAIDEVLDQHWNIFFSFVQGRNFNGKHVEPIKQITAESALGHSDF